MLCRKIVLLMSVVFFYFLSPAYGFNVTLQWCRTGDQCVSFYNVYYDTDSLGPPYQGAGAKQGKSPIRVYVEDINVCTQDTCTLKITGLSDTEMYYFDITACDGLGGESPYYSSDPLLEEVSTCQDCPTHGIDVEPCPLPIFQSCPPQITGFSSSVCEPGDVISIWGTNFGEGEGDDIVYIGRKEFGAGHRKIKSWSDTEIRIKSPKYKCRRFKKSEVREEKIWVTVDRDDYFQDSNEMWLRVNKPYHCR